MAVIEHLGLAVSIEINGVATPEYDDPEPSDNIGDPAFTAVCNKYIESQDDAEYAIHCRVTDEQKWLRESENRAINFTPVIDGKWIPGSLIEPGYRDLDETHIKGNRSGSTTTPMLQRFRFTAVKTVDDADASRVRKDLDRAKKLGLISVVVTRFLPSSYEAGRGEEAADDSFSVAEKALKGRAVSHGTSFSPAVKMKPWTSVSGEHLDSTKRPYAIFNLEYRSKDALRNEMIVPRSPSPALSIDGLGREEVQRLARERLAEIKKETKPAVKREFNEVFDLTEDDHAAPRRPLKILRRGNGRENIDLTDD